MVLWNFEYQVEKMATHIPNEDIKKKLSGSNSKANKGYFMMPDWKFSNFQIFKCLQGTNFSDRR